MSLSMLMIFFVGGLRNPILLSVEPGASLQQEHSLLFFEVQAANIELFLCSVGQLLEDLAYVPADSYDDAI